MAPPGSYTLLTFYRGGVFPLSYRGFPATWSPVLVAVEAVLVYDINADRAAR